MSLVGAVIFKINKSCLYLLDMLYHVILVTLLSIFLPNPHIITGFLFTLSHFFAQHITFIHLLVTSLGTSVEFFNKTYLISLIYAVPWQQLSAFNHADMGKTTEHENWIKCVFD